MAKSTPAQTFAKFFRMFMDKGAAPAERAKASVGGNAVTAVLSKTALKFSRAAP